MSPRKRRRSQVFLGSDGDACSVQDNDMDTEFGTHNIVEKEREIWDSFREEHYEGMRYSFPFTLLKNVKQSNNCL